MSDIVIVCWGYADGSSCPHSGKYLGGFDPEAEGGRGSAFWTMLPDKAMRFADRGAAFEFWKTVPKSRPTRPDGKPNRPLTAYNVEIRSQT